jgi:hypothetical protein
MKFSDFHVTKNRIVELIYILLNTVRNKYILVKYIYYNNIEENKSLEKYTNSIDWKLNTIFKYIVNNTP